VIAGGANNQLADPEVGRALFERGILYAPDYVINGGGIINVAGEIRALERGEAFDAAWVDGKLARLTQTLEEVLDRSRHEARPTHEVANEMARARISGAAEKRAAA
jgi:leucine dehydrogenase